MKLLLLVVFAACVQSRAPASPSTPDLAARRAQMIAWLHDYAAAGQFPMDAAGHPLSVFRDDRGVRCPMAELMYRSGHGDLVDQVARTHNDLRLADVHGGPLHAWIVASGLSQPEVEMIQGAMTVDEMRGLSDGAPKLVVGPGGKGVRIMPRAEELARATEWGEVRGHLETALVALRIATKPAVEAPARTLQALRTTAASTRTPGTTR